MQVVSILVSLVLMLGCVAPAGRHHTLPICREAKLLEKARQSLARGELDAAHTLLAEAVELAPGSADSWRWYAHVCVLMDDHHQALEHLDRALELEPGDPWTHYARGVSLKDLREYDGAIASFSRALALDPRHGKSLVHRAQASLLVGHRQDARVDLESAITMQSVDPGDLRWVRSTLDDLARDME